LVSKKNTGKERRDSYASWPKYVFILELEYHKPNIERMDGGRKSFTKKNGLDNAPNGRQKAEEGFLQTAVVIIESFRNLNRCIQFLY
jgi:hypothetical protein